CLMDTLGVAGAGVAAVDQDRLAGRGDDERRRPALGVDEVDVQPARLLLGPAGGGEQDQGQHGNRKPATTHKGPTQVAKTPRFPQTRDETCLRQRLYQEAYATRLDHFFTLSDANTLR